MYRYKHACVPVHSTAVAVWLRLFWSFHFLNLFLSALVSPWAWSYPSGAEDKVRASFSLLSLRFPFWDGKLVDLSLILPLSWINWFRDLRIRSWNEGEVFCWSFLSLKTTGSWIEVWWGELCNYFLVWSIILYLYGFFCSLITSWFVGVFRQL